MNHRLVALMLLLSTPLGCPAEDGAGQDTDGGDDETEVITTVTLTFTPSGGGAAVTASFRDPDGPGGVSGMTDAIALVAGTSYDLTVAFLDELDSPALDITAEVREEAEAHQVFVTGSAVTGPATPDNPAAIVEQAYADMESSYGTNTGDDLPVGLRHTVMTRSAGTGEFEVMLRHIPALNGAPQKLAGLAEALAAGEALPGEVDASVTFDLTVQ